MAAARAPVVTHYSVHVRKNIMTFWSPQECSIKIKCYYIVKRHKAKKEGKCGRGYDLDLPYCIPSEAMEKKALGLGCNGHSVWQMVYIYQS